MRALSELLSEIQRIPSPFFPSLNGWKTTIQRAFCSDIERGVKMKIENIKLDRKTVIVAASVLIAVILLIVVFSKCSANGGEETSSVYVPTDDRSYQYTVSFDSSVFTSEKKNGVERIKCIAAPESYLTISHVANRSYSDYINDALSGVSVNVNETDIKLEGNENSLGIRYSTGSFANDIITTLYAVDDSANGCFEIRYINTIGSDGDLGAKFKEIAQSFKLTE